MKMPEGWNKLRGMRFENADEVDILTALDLLKEFSEALETPGICTKITADKQNCAACIVYKKFHDWK